MFDPMYAYICSFHVNSLKNDNYHRCHKFKYDLFYVFQADKHDVNIAFRFIDIRIDI